MLAELPDHASAEAIQTGFYNVARPISRYQNLQANGATPERPSVSNAWFNMQYQVLSGENRGPLFGSFVALYGKRETQGLIARALTGALVTEHAAVPGRALSELVGRGPSMEGKDSLVRIHAARRPATVTIQHSYGAALSAFQQGC